MKFTPKQCRQCPFRKTSARGWLGRYTVGDIFRSIWHGEPFFCHTEIEGKDGFGYEKPDWQERAMAEGKLCVGGLAFANIIPAPMKSPYPQILAAREKVKTIKVECMSPKELHQHHEGADVFAKPKKKKGTSKSLEPRCDNCSKRVDDNHFCHGCKTHICDECDTNAVNMPCGPHDFELHLQDPDEDLFDDDND